MSSKYAIILSRPGAPEVDITEFVSTVSQSAVTATKTTTAVTTVSDPTKKKIDRLRKKLCQIEDLKRKRANGEKLEANQVIRVCQRLQFYTRHAAEIFQVSAE